MFASKQLEDLAKKLYSALPPGIQTLELEIQQQFKDILQSAFTRMDLVTREEFDVQVKVLARTREKIDLLQQQVDALLQKKTP
ncbi:MAG: accessory factor UbiK family protein [Legionellaceae bacterium]|nr:accessory factor UbiK family protein [Legionellaceae bacterium]